ncbi:MAG: HAMP domain-containing sensor histidine kinase [Vicinamibacterales bacterium]
MSLRVRLIGAFVVVLASLAGLGAWNAWRLWEMGAVSNRIIADNFDSVVAAQQMMESLERERGAWATPEGRAAFAAALDRASHNITESGEQDIVNAIRTDFDGFTEARLGHLRERLDALVAINQAAMRRRSAEAATIARTTFASAIGLAALLTMAGIVLGVLLVRESKLEEVMRARQVLLDKVTQLHELDRMKSAFIANAAHELQTPLMSFQMGVHLLLENAANLSPRQLEVATICRDESTRLARLSTDLLDLSKIESGEAPPRLTTIPVETLIRQAVEPLRTQIEAHGLALLVDLAPGLPAVLADRAQIERVLTNLVTNAVRATKAGGRITVSAAAAAVGHVRFAVSDTGAGIPADYLGRIFEPFVQVPGVPAGAAGLGLSIAQRIIEAHGGRISVVSTPGSGSTFAFTLPAPSGS